jgi:hypothetical protein
VYLPLFFLFRAFGCDAMQCDGCLQFAGAETGGVVLKRERKGDKAKASFPDVAGIINFSNSTPTDQEPQDHLIRNPKKPRKKGHSKL